MAASVTVRQIRTRPYGSLDQHSCNRVYNGYLRDATADSGLRMGPVSWDVMNPCMVPGYARRGAYLIVPCVQRAFLVLSVIFDLPLTTRRLVSRRRRAHLGDPTRDLIPFCHAPSLSKSDLRPMSDVRGRSTFEPVLKHSYPFPALPLLHKKTCPSQKGNIPRGCSQDSLNLGHHGRVFARNIGHPGAFCYKACICVIQSRQ